MKEIAIAEYPIRYDGKVLHVSAADVEAVEVSIGTPSAADAEEAGCVLTIKATFKPGAGPVWQTEK